MSAFHIILSQFNKLSLSEQSKLRQFEIAEKMDELARMNTTMNGFDRDIGEQLWEHSNKTPDGAVLIKDYIQTVIDARNMLNDNIVKCQEQLKTSTDPAVNQQLQQFLVSYKQDLQIISDVFELQQPSLGISPIQSRGHHREGDQHSDIFADLPSKRQTSTTLKIVFIMLVIMICCQLLCMQGRDHFMNLLTYATILGVFFRSYFDRTYMITVLVMLGVTSALDITWLVVEAPYYWFQSKVSQLTNHQPGFLAIVYLLTFFLMCAKVVLFILLFRFRKNDFMTKKVVQVFSLKLYLNGKDSSNPISKIVGDSGTNTRSYD